VPGIYLWKQGAEVHLQDYVRTAPFVYCVHCQATVKINRVPIVVMDNRTRRCSSC
jgi:hypothetical protein